MAYFKYLVYRVLRFIRGVFIVVWISYMLFNFLVLLPDDTYKNLQSLTIDRFDNLYIADASNGKVLKYDTQGKPIKTWGGKGSGDGQFGQYYSPKEIVASPQGELLATDEENKRIQRYDANGRFLGTWGSGPNVPYGAINMVIDNQGQVYVPGDKGIAKYDAYGNYLGALGEGLPEQAQLLNGEKNLAVNLAGEVYSYGQVRGRIFRFDAKGQPLPSLYIQNLDLENFNNFSKMTLDRQDNIYFMDLNNNLVIKLDPTGQFLASWPFNDKPPLSLSYRGMVIDSRNNLYLLNSQEYQLEVFDATGRSIKQFSIGWPQWLTKNVSGLIAFSALIFSLLNLALVKVQAKNQANKPAKPREPFLAPSLAGKVSQLLNFLATITALFVTLPLVVSVTGVPAGRFISFENGPGADLVGRIVFLLVILAMMLVTLVAKRPVFAGLGQVALASIIYFASLDQYLKILAIVIVIGGLLAIAGSIKRNVQVPPKVP